MPLQETLILKFKPKKKSTEEGMGKSIFICPLFTFPDMPQMIVPKSSLPKKESQE